MDATGPPDARELAAFSELEGKLVDASRRVKTVTEKGRERGEKEKERKEMMMMMGQSISLERGGRRAVSQPRTPRPLTFFPLKTPHEQQAEQTALSAIQAGRRAALTRAEVEAAPEGTRTWAAVGRA